MLISPVRHGMLFGHIRKPTRGYFRPSAKHIACWWLMHPLFSVWIRNDYSLLCSVPYSQEIAMTVHPEGAHFLFLYFPHITLESTTDRQLNFGAEDEDLLSWHQFLKTYFHHNDIYLHSTCSGCLNVSFLLLFGRFSTVWSNILTIAVAPHSMAVACISDGSSVWLWLRCRTSIFYQMFFGSIPQVCMSKCPWAKYWTPIAGPCMAATATSVWILLNCMKNWMSLWTIAKCIIIIDR